MKNKIIALAVTSVLGTLPLQQAEAAAFNLNEHSASGLGRAFAGEAAIADNASVLANNPAAMTLFKQKELSVAGTYIDPNINMTGRSDYLGGAVSKDKLNAQDVAPTAFIPSIYYVQPLNDKWAWGIGIFTNFGLATKYKDDYAGGLLGGETDLTTMNINPNIAYRLNEHWSLGAGLNAIYGDAKLVRRAGVASSLLPIPGANASTEVTHLSGDTWGWGWNVGALYELNQNHRWGLAYRSGSTLKFDGDYKGTASGLQQVPGELDLKLPGIAEFSGYHLLNPQVAVHYSVQWTNWAVFDQLRATSDSCNDGSSGECFLKKEEFSNSWRYAIGTTYFLNNAWTLRAGFALDRQAAHNVISIPDTERQWYSMGFSYQWSRALGFDFGLAYLRGKSVDINEPMPLSSLPDVEYSSDATAWLGSAQINYRF